MRRILGWMSVLDVLCIFGIEVMKGRFLFLRLPFRAVTSLLRYVSTTVDTSVSRVRQISAHDLPSSVIASNERHRGGHTGNREYWPTSPEDSRCPLTAHASVQPIEATRQTQSSTSNSLLYFSAQRGWSHARKSTTVSNLRWTASGQQVERYTRLEKL